MSNVSDNLKLDNPSREVEIVSAEGITWQESTSRADMVAVWLGNATERDRKAIRDLAKRIAPDRAIRISFPSVMTFILGYDQQYRKWVIFVPESEV